MALVTETDETHLTTQAGAGLESLKYTVQKAEPGADTQFFLRDGGSGRILGAIRACPAESSATFRHLLPEHAASLASCYLVGVPEVGEVRLTSLLYYLAAREARRLGRSLLVTEGQGAAGTTHPPDGLQVLETGPAPWAGVDVQRAAFTAFSRMPREVQNWTADNLMTDELEGTIRDRAEQFYGTAFFSRIFAKTLTRSQYIESVANNHQFVRWTTRLLGRLVGMTSDMRLRKHFVGHLNGEIDHEVLLENDLRYLGADVEYVKNDMVPCREIQQFMCVQEAMIGFHQDPVLCLAVPFAIESATALMDIRFIDALRACIAGWGYTSPGRGCTFLSSHIKTDGGDDGHWEATKRMLRIYMRDETRLQRALNVANLVMDGVNRAYEAYGNRANIEDLRKALGSTG